jgi:hypothetical protein
MVLCMALFMDSMINTCVIKCRTLCLFVLPLITSFELTNFDEKGPQYYYYYQYPTFIHLQIAFSNFILAKLYTDISKALQNPIGLGF